MPMVKTLAIIPARGGSKGIPRKNVLPVAGKPLLVWTVEAVECRELADLTSLPTKASPHG